MPPSASLYVATEQIPRSSPPHRAHRVPPPASPLALRRPRALAGKNRAVCIPFSPNARKRPLSWQHPPEMHAFRDQDGNILALCIHSRVQSGDSGYMARESCRQGPFFASRNPKSRMARRCCQRRPAFLRQQPAVRRNGLCAMRQRHAARGMAERALRPAARAWPACRMPLPAISPAFIAAVLYASRFATRIVPTVRRHSPHRPLRSGRAAYRSLPAALVLPTPTHRAHRSGTGTARAPARANRTPALSQPSPACPWSYLRPPAPRHPPRLTLPRGSRFGSGNSREMVR